MAQRKQSAESRSKIRAWSIAFWQRTKADPEAFAAQCQKISDGFARQRQKGIGFFKPKK
jgi:hypothetical protein